MPLTIYSNSTTASQKKDQDRIALLDLPYEIRLRIYHLIYLASPVQRRQLAPWHCIQNCRTYTVRPISAGGDDDQPESLNTTDKPTTKQPVPRGLLSPNRPLCRIPTALARSCRQIYAEASVIPFNENEFVFLNWFALGLSSALAFLQGREQWQRAEMRFMRLEIFARDLVSESAKFADFVQLCEYLSDLRGFRLLLYLEGDAAYQTFDHVGMRMMEKKAVSVDERGLEDAQELVHLRTEWITKGLARLKSLKQLEVDLVDVKWTGREKMEWCARLRELLELSNGGNRARILSVEKLVRE